MLRFVVDRTKEKARFLNVGMKSRKTVSMPEISVCQEVACASSSVSCHDINLDKLGKGHSTGPVICHKESDNEFEDTLTPNTNAEKIPEQSAGEDNTHENTDFGDQSDPLLSDKTKKGCSDDGEQIDLQNTNLNEKTELGRDSVEIMGDTSSPPGSQSVEVPVRTI